MHSIHIANTVDDLLIFRKLRVKAVPFKAPKIILVRWTLPNSAWIKVNTDGAANRCLGPSGGIFQTSCGFVKGCFVIPLGFVYAFEAELLAVMHALEIADKNNLDHFWVK